MSLEEGNRPAYHNIVEEKFKRFHMNRFSPQAVSGSLLRCITGILAVVHEMGGNDEGLQQLKELAQQSHEGWNLRLLKNAFLIALEEAENMSLICGWSNPKGISAKSNDILMQIIPRTSISKALLRSST